MRIELPERLGDEHVVLRPLRAEDVAPYAAAFRADPALGRLLGMEQDPDEAGVRNSVERSPQRAADGSVATLAVADPQTGGFWGAVIMHSFEWHHRRCEVGFWLIPEVRARGVGSRAVAMAVSWAFETLDLLRVEMTTTPENEAVGPLARRLGFAHEGVLRRRNVERDQRVDVEWFGLLREEWAAR